jgi:hypothetical protein
MTVPGWQCSDTSSSHNSVILRFYLLLKQEGWWLFVSGFFLILGFELRALHLLGRHSATHASRPFYFSFQVELLIFCLKLVSDWDPSTHTSHVARITDACYHTRLICRDGVSLGFCQDRPASILLIPAFQVVCDINCAGGSLLIPKSQLCSYCPVKPPELSTAVSHWCPLSFLYPAASFWVPPEAFFLL